MTDKQKLKIYREESYGRIGPWIQRPLSSFLPYDGPAGAPGSRNSWWYAECAIHGKQPHLSIRGGQCEKCAAEECAKGK